MCIAAFAINWLIKISLDEHGTQVSVTQCLVTATAQSELPEEIASRPRLRLRTLLPDGPAELVFKLEGHTAPFASLAFSPDGRTIASSSADGTLRFWDLINEAEVGQCEATASKWTIDLAFDSGGTATRCRALAWGGTESSNDRRFDAIATSPDGRFLVSGGGGVWSEEQGTIVGDDDYAIYVWRLSEEVWPQGAPTEIATPKKDDDRYVAVAIREVKLDIDPNELNDMRQMDDREWQRYMQVQNLTHADVEVRVGLLATLFGGMSDNAARKERETKLERDRREREEIERAFRQIKRFEDSLQGELRKKLAQLEIPLLERESTQDLRDERELADDPEFRGRTESNFVSMYCASHMVLANIRWPQSGGSYELDVRLVDVRTGAIVWSDQRDRKFSKDMEPEVTALRCSLRTGRLARVDFVGSSSRSADLMSVPLGAPQLLATDASVTARPPALLHIEQASDSSSILLRDLFANERVEWPRSELQLSLVSDSFKDVPSGHEMRYLLWRTSSAIIPAGGRILQVDGSTARVGLGKQHGISPTDRLGVVRFTQLESGEIQQNPLSVELVVSTVDETQCSASVQSITNVQLGDNDVAVPKKGQRLKVAVIDPEFRLTDPKLQITANRLNRAQQQRLYQFTVQNGATLAAKFRAGLTKLQVPIVLAEDLPQDFRGGTGNKAFWDAKSASETARQANASHLLVGTISPTQTTVPCTCVLQLAVIDAASGEFVERFQVELNRSQLENLAHWSP